MENDHTRNNHRYNRGIRNINQRPIWASDIYCTLLCIIDASPWIVMCVSLAHHSDGKLLFIVLSGEEDLA